MKIAFEFDQTGRRSGGRPAHQERALTERNAPRTNRTFLYGLARKTIEREGMSWGVALMTSRVVPVPSF